MTTKDEISDYFRAPGYFPPEYLWWLRRVIEEEKTGGGEGDTAPVVVLTQAQYDALAVKDPATVYVVT